MQLAAGFYFKKINTLVTEIETLQYLILSDENMMLILNLFVVYFHSTSGVFYGNVYICNNSPFQALSNLPT